MSISELDLLRRPEQALAAFFMLQAGWHVHLRGIRRDLRPGLTPAGQRTLQATSPGSNAAQGLPRPRPIHEKGPRSGCYA